MGQVDRRGSPGEKRERGEERTGRRERRKRECRAEHTRTESSVYGCARTHVAGVASAAADVAAVPRYRRSCWTPSASPRDMIYQPFLRLLASPSCTLFVLFLPHSCAAPGSGGGGGGGGGAGTVLLLAILFSALSKAAVFVRARALMLSSTTHLSSFANAWRIGRRTRESLISSLWFEIFSVPG